MSGFSFSTTAGASQSNVKPALKGNAIHTVVLEGCEIKNFDGKKDPTKTFETFVLKFGNEDGVYEHTIFAPTTNGYMGKSDFERGESQFKDRDGKLNKIPQPSNVESLMLLFKHAIDALVPELGAQIDNKEKELSAPDWNGLRELVKGLLEPAIKAKTPTKIKLMNNNKGEAKFPGFFAAVNREGDAYIKNNFIGKKVAFSAYELGRINNATTAKPTEMGDSDNLLVDDNDGVGNLDMGFDI